MGTTYKEADKDVYAIMNEVLDEHFPDIKGIEPELSITVLMAWNVHGNPIKLAGSGCTAKVKVVGGEERSQGASDVRILIDTDRWHKLSDPQRHALFHHELRHIKPQYDRKSGILKIDDYGRPMIKLRPDDWLITGFEATARIFGEDSLERQAVVAVYETLRQMELPFDRGDDVAREVAADPAEATPKAKGKRRKPAAVQAEA